MDLKKYTFRKRDGTTGIHGDLYETKLISLILFKLLHNENIEEFYLASNMDDVGDFDDICLKVRIKGIDKYLMLFLQAKHKEKDDAYLTYDLIETVQDSLIKMNKEWKRNKTNPENIFFIDNYNDIDLFFILYTNVEYKPRNNQLVNLSDLKTDEKDEPSIKNNKSNLSKVNDLIITNNKGFRLNENNDALECISKLILDAEISSLAIKFAQFLNDKSKFIMEDNYILRYHFILREKVVDVSEIHPKREEKSHLGRGVGKTKNPTESWRYMTFKSSFFNTEDSVLKNFRGNIYNFIVNNKGNIKKSNITIKMPEHSQKDVDRRISTFLKEPTAINLSYLIDTYIIYTNDKLTFKVERADVEQKQLEVLKVSSTTVDEARVIFRLMHSRFKVPVSFGNLDMTFKENPKKRDNQMAHLTSVIKDLCEQAKYDDPYYIVNIDETTDQNCLRLSGGIAGAVGNLLEYDPITKLIKFTDGTTRLQTNAKLFFCRLSDKFKNNNNFKLNLKFLRFKIQNSKFPKFLFDYTHDAKILINKVLVYDKQNSQADIEEILTKEIKEYEQNISRTLPVKYEILSVYYHHVIQEWWMTPMKVNECLTKANNLYETAVQSVASAPLMISLQNTFFNNIQRHLYVFKEHAMKNFNSLSTVSNIITTDIPFITTTKIIQYLNKNNNNYAVLELKCIINILDKEFQALITELKDTDKLIILVCDVVAINETFSKRFLAIAEAVDKKEIIIGANKEFIAKFDLNKIKQDFKQIHNDFCDENIALVDFVQESQNVIIENAQILLQGKEISLKNIVSVKSLKFVKGLLLKKVLLGETVTVGASLTDTKYEKIKHLYIKRRLREETCDEGWYVETFNDIKQTSVLITAGIGMGKSTLLTNLALKTKEINNDIWIIKVALSEHCHTFYNWDTDEINILKAVKFLCQTVVKNVSFDLTESDNKIYLKDCFLNDKLDDLAAFELCVFLECYNNGKLIVVFDDFDEICLELENAIRNRSRTLKIRYPDYKGIVLKLLEVVRDFPEGNIMWVTSRPHNEITPDLRRVVDVIYNLEHFDNKEQQLYLKLCLESNININKMNDKELEHVKDCAKRFLLKIRLAKIPKLIGEIFIKMYSFFFDLIYTSIKLPYGRSGDEIKYIKIAIPRSIPTHLLGDDIIEQNPSTSDVILPSTDAIDDFTQLDTIAELPLNKLIEAADFAYPINSVRATSSEMADEFIYSPLHLYLMADYFNNVLNGKETKQLDNGNAIINIITMYESFVETKLKTIYVDKDGIDVSKPRKFMMYEEKINDCFNIHKKLAAYAVLEEKIFNVFFPRSEFGNFYPYTNTMELETDIRKVKNEQYDFINNVTTDNIPVFIHKTFAEYFATEYLCDLFKSEIEFDKKKLLYAAIGISGSELKRWLNEKLAIDNELFMVIKSITCKNLVISSWWPETFLPAPWAPNRLLRILASCPDDYTTDLIPLIDDIPFYKLSDSKLEHIINMRFQKHVIPNMKPYLRQYFVD